MSEHCEFCGNNGYDGYACPKSVTGRHSWQVPVAYVQGLESRLLEAERKARAFDRIAENGGVVTKWADLGGFEAELNGAYCGTGATLLEAVENASSKSS